MSMLGIYFGPKAISVVEAQGRKVIRSSLIPQTTVSAGELEEKVPVEVKTIEVIALIKEEIRKNNIKAKEAVLSLSGKDMIIRTFEMPAMPQHELESAISFEAKKYIPFKVEELITDFQVQYEKDSRTNSVLFTGIKKDALEKYLSIMSQLDIKVSAIEYSAFSLQRVFKLAGISDSGVFAVLDADTAEEDEINFIVVEDGFPLFSRDIALGASQAGPGVSKEAVPGEAAEKLKTEVRISLDYYQRKYPSKNIKKIFLIVNQDSRTDLQSFLAEIGLNVQAIDIGKALPRDTAYSLSFLKGYSAALSSSIRINVKTNLITAKEKTRPAEEKTFKDEITALLKGIKLDLRFLVLGVLACAAAYSYGLYRTQPVNKEIETIIGARVKSASIAPDSTYEQLTSLNSQYQMKLSILDNLIKKQLSFTVPLNIIPQVIPEGVWLTRFSFSRKEEGRSELMLEGMAYASDAEKEFLLVNQFLSGLKNDPQFSSFFKDAAVTMLDRRKLEKFTATYFSISCKSL